MSDKLLEVKNLSVEYDTEISTVYAVNGLDLDLNYGETLGLVGETGAGKTTTALSVIQLLPEGIGFVTDGSIKLDGVDMLNAPEEKIRAMRGSVVSMIFQDPMASLNPRKKVEDIIGEGLDIHHMYKTKEERRDKVEKILAKVGLAPEHAERYPHQFSGGQRQRVGIARALVLNPALVICDEPISALDVSIQAQVVNLLRDYQQAEGTSYLFIAHDLSMVRYVSDDIGVMYLGQLVESSDSEEIYKNPLHPYTKGLLSCIPIADPKLARAHASAGVEGDLPSPVNPKPGCRFCGRCPYAKPICSEQTPAMKEAAPGHFVACHLY